LQRQCRDTMLAKTTTDRERAKQNEQVKALLEQGKDLQEAVLLLRERIIEIENDWKVAKQNHTHEAAPVCAPPPVPQNSAPEPPTPSTGSFGAKTLAPLVGRDNQEPTDLGDRQSPVNPAPQPADITGPAKVEDFPGQNGTEEQSVFGADTLTMHLQPIVALADGEPALFEALIRLQEADGTYVDDVKFEKLAEAGGMLPAIEKKVIFSSARAIGMLQGAGQTKRLVASLSVETFKNGGLFGDIVGFLATRGDLQSTLLFSIDQQDFARLDREQRGRMSILYNMGFRFVMDKMLDLNAHPGALAAAGFRYVKVPATIVAHSNIGTRGRITPQTLVKIFADRDLQLIASNVDRDADKDHLMALGVKYAQGVLLGRPRAVKPEFVDIKRAA